MNSFEEQKREIQMKINPPVVPLTQEQEDKRRYRYVCRSCTINNPRRRSCDHAPGFAAEFLNKTENKSSS